MNVDISPKVTGPVPEPKHSLSLSLSQKDHKSNKNVTNGQDKNNSEKEKSAQSKQTKNEDNTVSSTPSIEKEDFSKIGKNKNVNSKSSQKSSENGNANDQDKKVPSGKDDGKSESKNSTERKVKNDNTKTTESTKSEAVPKTEKEKTKVEPAPKTEKDKTKAESTPKLDKEKIKHESPTKVEKAKSEATQKSEKTKNEPKNNTTERKTRKAESSNDSENIKARRPSQSKMDISTEKEISSTKTDKKEVTKAKAANKHEADINSSDTVSDPVNGGESKFDEKGEATKRESSTPIADEEMAPLSVDSEHETNDKLIAGKVLKLKSTPISQKFSSPEKARTTEKISRKVLPDSPLSSSTIRSEQLRSPIPSSLRQISGRRSFKNLADMPVRKHNFETYRPYSMELDNTSSSLNVTVGSEVAADSSFTFFGFGRKRDHVDTDTQSTQSDTDNAAKTPKRVRLDTSGILNIVKTPITLLRSRFARVDVHSSTPNIDNQKHVDDEEDGVENVSVADAEEALNHIAAPNEEIELKEFKDDSDEAESVEEPLKETLKMDVEDENVEGTVAETAVGDKKRGCNIM